MKNNQKGFSAIEILLIVGIVGIIGGIGWYVVRSNKEIDKNLNAAGNTSIASPSKTHKSSETTKTIDETANWAKVTSGKSAFSVKMPDGWNLQNWTSRDYLYAGSYKDLTFTNGKRATVASGDSYALDSGPVRHFNITADPIAQKSSIGYYFNETPQEFGPVSGITGNKYIHTYTEDIDGIKKGDKVYLYRFEGTKTLVTVDYYVLNGESDQSALMEKSIKTLSFE
jgi:hypothetical protein